MNHLGVYGHLGVCGHLGCFVGGGGSGCKVGGGCAAVYVCMCGALVYAFTHMRVWCARVLACFFMLVTDHRIHTLHACD